MISPFCNLQQFKLENDEQFPIDFVIEVLTYLKERFQNRLKSAEDGIRIFQNPFSIEI